MTECIADLDEQLCSLGRGGLGLRKAWTGSIVNLQSHGLTGSKALEVAFCWTMVEKTFAAAYKVVVKWMHQRETTHR